MKEANSKIKHRRRRTRQNHHGNFNSTIRQSRWNPCKWTWNPDGQLFQLAVRRRGFLAPVGRKSPPNPSGRVARKGWTKSFLLWQFRFCCWRRHRGRVFLLRVLQQCLQVVFRVSARKKKQHQRIAQLDRCTKQMMIRAWKPCVAKGSICKCSQTQMKLTFTP